MSLGQYAIKVDGKCKYNVQDKKFQHVIASVFLISDE